ncbi:MAG: tRNA pseudouridine(55) synthase TruB [Gammaproteobacteria bacterium]|nr:MAG: tRNA pseudouridine(55) synthase TruB [Gammaproteobacteria bacterium]
MGRRRKRKPHERDVHGILLLDKPAGITSNDALQRIKRLYRAARAGHTGSLDKPATGMLPLCLGEATKISSYLLNADKTYVAVARLGEVTSTADAEGEVLETRQVPELNQELLEKVIAQFVGDIEQVPPMYSALKIDGQRLYKLAYQGLEVERKARPVTIKQIDLQHFDEDSFAIQVHCSKGTYIRTLIEDIGQALGCGAHVSSLRRLSTGPFKEAQMVSMETIEDLAKEGEDGDAALDQLLVPGDSALEHLAEVNLSEEMTYYLCLGQAVSVPQAPTDGLVRIYDHNHAFIGIGTILDDGRVAPKRILKTSN